MDCVKRLVALLVQGSNCTSLSHVVAHSSSNLAQAPPITSTSLFSLSFYIMAYLRPLPTARTPCTCQKSFKILPTFLANTSASLASPLVSHSLSTNWCPLICPCSLGIKSLRNALAISRADLSFSTMPLVTSAGKNAAPKLCSPASALGPTRNKKQSCVHVNTTNTLYSSRGSPTCIPLTSAPPLLQLLQHFTGRTRFPFENLICRPPPTSTGLP